MVKMMDCHRAITPPSLRSAPYFPKDSSKATQMMPPARDYRWGLIRNRSTPAAPVAPVTPVSPPWLGIYRWGNRRVRKFARLQWDSIAV